MTAEAYGVSMAEVYPSDKRMDEFLAMAQYQAEHALPQNNDIYTKAFEAAFNDRLQSDGSFRSIYAEIFADNHRAVADEVQLTADDLIRQNVKTFQFLERERYPTIFPSNRSTPDAWSAAFDSLVHDEEYREDFYVNIHKPLASNISERGSPIKTEIMLHELEAPTIFDAGCSLNNLLKRMALEDDPDLVYNHININRRPSHRSRATVFTDDETTRRFNDWLGSDRVVLGPSVGVDVIDYSDPKNVAFRDRAFSDSHYMGEFTVDSLAQQADILEHVQPTNITSMALDVSDFDPASFGRKFDVTLLSTMLYESKSSQSTVQRILENARAITEDDGIIIVQDFVRRVFKSGTVEFYKKWRKYDYGVWVEDRRRPELGLQKHFSIFNGRIDSLIPEPALANLPMARKLGLVASTGLKRA